MPGRGRAQQRVQEQELGPQMCGPDGPEHAGMEDTELWGNQAMAEFLGLGGGGEGGGEGDGAGAIAGPGGPGDQLGTRLAETEAQSVLPGPSDGNELPAGEDAVCEEVAEGMETGMDGGGIVGDPGAHRRRGACAGQPGRAVQP